MIFGKDKKFMNRKTIEKMYEKFPRLQIGVVGDFVLDKYLTVDTALNEPSLETCLTAYQVVETRQYPGACGTITNNLGEFGIGGIYAVTFVGKDGAGFELKEELIRRRVQLDYVLETDRMITPSYVKPMMRTGSLETESHRLDIKNFHHTPKELEDRMVSMLDEVFQRMDGVIILDQMVENNCGVITDRVRERLIELGESYGDKLIFADSRSRIHLFRHVVVKCNNHEICRGIYPDLTGTPSLDMVTECAESIHRQNGKPVFVTIGKGGILTFGSQGNARVPTAEIPGPLDICGAGDAVTAAALSALLTGCNEIEAAFFANMVASVTIRKLGITGTATYDEIMETYETYFLQLPW